MALNTYWVPQVQQAGSPIVAPVMSSLGQAIAPTRPQLQSPGQNLGPLMSLLSQPSEGGGPSPLQNIMNGVGNIFQGNQWNGMPGSTQMDALSTQAASNIAGGVGSGGFGSGAY